MFFEYVGKILHRRIVEHHGDFRNGVIFQKCTRILDFGVIDVILQTHAEGLFQKGGSIRFGVIQMFGNAVKIQFRIQKVTVDIVSGLDRLRNTLMYRIILSYIRTFANVKTGLFAKTSADKETKIRSPPKSICGLIPKKAC